MSFLAIDIGNTRLKWALYAGPQPGSPMLAHGAQFLENIEKLAEHDWADLPTPGSLLGCNVAGDGMRHRVEEQLEELWDLEPRWVASSSQAGGVTNGYDHPTRLGTDRFVAMIGARHHVLTRSQGRAPQPALVVMVGTAVTVDALDAEGRFLGGLILPGHGIMLRALEGGTAGLRVPTGEVREFPTNTSDALTSGGNYAITGAIERMHRHMVRRCGQVPLTLMTGGAGWKVSPSLDIPHELMESLIFDGLLALQSHRLAL
ncbi:type III pantothenate kinase [Roseateles terrae]|uniref:Type III pantothenate kinase n=1 Tax=Roseateles terrae TaxID=431060 RepID=A0ABR6GYT6_9BURK|nr:type III pantothenate kinase [Roseateles terrae]MBB3197229.1 type III pantothenate kinase [Roseateles terrae]OWQ83704.1 type III pantothenate kinase [Roseateles terrae]